jgi:hypothetical protein
MHTSINCGLERQSFIYLSENFARDSGRTLVRTEYGYPKESSNTNS